MSKEQETSHLCGLTIRYNFCERTYLRKGKEPLTWLFDVDGGVSARSRKNWDYCVFSVKLCMCYVLPSFQKRFSGSQESSSVRTHCNNG